MKITRHIVLASALVMMMMTTMTSAASATSLYYSDASVTVDGEVKASEYPYQLALKDLDGNDLATVYFFHDGTNVYVGIVAPHEAWTGFGMNKQGQGMIGGDFIITEKVKDDWVVYDAYSDAQAAPVADDDSKLIESAASVVSGKLNTEFSFPMSSSDSKDISFAVGDTVSFFVAGGEADVTAIEYHVNHRVDPIDLKIEAQDVEAPGSVLTLSTAEKSSFLPVFIASVAVLAVLPVLRRRR